MNLKLGLLVAAVAALVLGAAGFYVQNSIFNLKEELSKPWIEVVAPGVFELAEDQKTEKRELQTGDELENGMTIGVRKGALANIYFTDGSVARLDSGTRLVVEAGDFEEKTNKLNVRLNLLWGRVWSKVITVLTPESAWEVKTTNAVAVVRGTAFGVEYVEEGKSNIVGYENKVEVKLIDPATNKVMPAIAMVVEAKKVLEVRKEAIESTKAHFATGELRQAASAIATKVGQPIMEVKAVSEKVLNQDWVKRGIEADEKLNQKIRAKLEKAKDRKEAIMELRKEVKEEFRGKIQERQKALKAAVEKEKNELKEKRDNLENKVLETRQELKENLERATEELKTSEIQTVTSVTPIVKNLSIRPNQDLNLLVEGDSVVFRSFAQYADGSEKEVTLESNWKVMGGIGFMKSPGVFVGKLSDAVSELGAAPGAVIASWKDLKTGNIFEAASPIFKVELEIDLNFDPTRG
ncbi:MAG: FecR domain-containing protein [Candidatus Harrisonbacteria bacterium]|nr:FecR domain-containing protein [Candidatus Harrisonbacteria bacterium]